MSEKQIVYTPSLFDVDESFDDPRFMRVRINMMTTGVNRNGSRFSLDCVKKAKDSFANIPVLAHVVERTDDDGNTYLDYGSHDMHIEDDAFNEDEQRIIYDEAVVGVVPEKNDLQIIKNKDTGEYNVFVTALLYRDYGNYVCDILESRNGQTDVSMEIICEDLSYSSKDKVIDVGKMTACGVTLLGADVIPAMPGAQAETFSIDNDNRQNQMIRIMQELRESLDNYMAKHADYNQGKEGSQMQFEENVEVTETLEAEAETVEVEATEDMADETTTTDESAEEETVTEALSEDADETTPSSEEFESTEETEEAEDAESEESVETESDETTEESDDAVKYSVTLAGETKEFSVSLNQKIMDLTTLVNEVYADADGTYYSCDVFEDGKKYVVMHDFWVDRHFRQEYSYSNRTSSYSLKGDRVPVFTQYLTEDEMQKLDAIKTDYAEVTKELAQFKAEPEKLELLNSDRYDLVRDQEAFTELSKRDAYFELSVDEIKEKADAILLEYAATATKADFAARTEDTEADKKVVSRKAFSIIPKKKNYGSLLNV